MPARRRSNLFSILVSSFLTWAGSMLALTILCRYAVNTPLDTSEWLVGVVYLPIVAGLARFVVYFSAEHDATVQKQQAELIAQLTSSLDELKAKRRSLSSSQTTLWQQQFHLNAILRNAPLILCVFDNKGDYNQSRGYGLNKLGLAENELIGGSYKTIYKDHPNVVSAIEKALNGTPSNVQVSLSDGLHHEIRYQPFLDENGIQQGVVGVGIDLSERIKAELDRRILEERVFESRIIESLGSLAGGVAHDFNNYLMAIVAFAETMLNELASPDQLCLEQLENTSDSIRDTAMSAAGICQQMLVLSGQSRESKSRCDLNEIVDNSMALLKAILPVEVSLVLEVKKSPAIVFVDELLVQRALFNIFKNAAEAVEGQAETKIVVSTEIKNPGDLKKNRCSCLWIRG